MYFLEETCTRTCTCLGTQNQLLALNTNEKIIDFIDITYIDDVPWRTIVYGLFIGSRF